MSPSGAAVYLDGLAHAYRLALSADPVSPYGGILAFNRRVDDAVAAAVIESKVFYESSPRRASTREPAPASPRAAGMAMALTGARHFRH